MYSYLIFPVMAHLDTFQSMHTVCIQVLKHLIPRKITDVKQREVEESRINNNNQFQQFTFSDLFLQ